MLKQYATFFRRSMIFVDALIAGGSFILAFIILSHHHKYYFSPLSNYIWILPFLSISWGGSLYFLGMYRSFRLKTFPNILFLLLSAACTVFVLFSSFAYLLGLEYVSRQLIISTFILTTVLIAAEKLILFILFRHLRSKGFNFRNILIVGTGKRASHFIDQITEHKDFGLRIIGIIDVDESKIGQKIKDYPIIGTLKDIKAILLSNPVDNVFFILPRLALDSIKDQVLDCETLGITFSIAVDLFDMQFTNGRPESLLGISIVTFESVSQKHIQLIFKRIIDIILSGAGLIILSPLLLILTFLVSFTSQGSAIFTQIRCGLNGRRFKMYKFRTMLPGAEKKLNDLMVHNQMGGPAFKMQNDPRVTFVGKFLRKFSLDELPQLWNVFIGDMSLVGPRPPLPREVEQYGLWHRRRLSMPPGITCLWQIKGRNKITDFDEWAKLDLKYIDEWSLLLDFNILLKTIPAVLSSSGAK